MCFTKYYKNFLLCGEVDYHCLLCNETFHNLNDVEKHIRWEKHRKALKTQTCLPKFKSDGVFKIESYYYCQYCNHVAYNMASIKEHAKTESHISNKTCLKAVTTKSEMNYVAGAVSMNKILIDSCQWHGIQNNRCIFCNIVVNNMTKHIATQDHIIRVIQTRIKCVGEENNYYREINDTTFQCFQCNKTFPFEDFDKHWEQHRNQIDKTSDDSTKNPTKIHDRGQYEKLRDQEYDVAKLANINDDLYEIDLQKKEIICKQCKVAVRNSINDLFKHKFNYHEDCTSVESNIEKKMKEDFEKEYIFVYEKDAGKARHELAVYGKANHIKLNAGGSKGYCMLCDRFLSAHMNIFTQHVGASVHTGHLEIKGQVKPKKHKKGLVHLEKLRQCVNELHYIPDFDAVLVNAVFCIDRDSFLLMKRVHHGTNLKFTKCFACDETFKWCKEKEHSESKTHQSHVLAARVVIEELNFIRQIKPKLYHCGFCNTTLPFWENVQKHINDMSHKMHVMEKHFKTSMKHYMKEHGTLPEIQTIEHSTIDNVLYANILKVF